MSEVSPNPTAPEQSLMFRARHYAAAGIAAIAGVVPIHRIEQDTWTEQVPYTDTVPESIFTVGHPISETVVHDQEGNEVAPDDLSKLFLFDIEDEAEREEFIEAVKAVIDPEQDVLITRDGADVIIRTGDFARVENAGDPTDEQSSTLRVSVDGRLIHATGMDIDMITIPEHEVVKTRGEEHSTTEEILYYQQAVVPEKPKIAREHPPIKIRKQPSAGSVSPENSPEAEEPETPENETVPEPQPPVEPSSDKPEAERTVTPPAEPEQPKPRQLEQPGAGGDGVQGKQQRQRGFGAAEVQRILDDISQESTAFSRGFGREPRSFDVRLPRISGCFPKIILIGLLISGAAAAWNQSEFQSVEDCELGTPEQPLNIVKERGEWLPEISRPDCPEPEGHVVRITFDGFERGYATASLSDTGNISNIVGVPQELMPEAVIDSVIGGRFVGRVDGLLRDTDVARAAIAEQSGAEHNPLVFGDEG